MKIADDVLAVLSAAKVDGNSLYLHGQLEQKYNNEPMRLVEESDEEL